MDNKTLALGLTGVIVVVVAGAGAGILSANNNYSKNPIFQITQLDDKAPEEEVKLNGWKKEKGTWYFYKITKNKKIG